ncbi:MAG: mechanosensitive ion channel domain-containing protein [Bacteroidota bacterium]
MIFKKPSVEIFLLVLLLGIRYVPSALSNWINQRPNVHLVINYLGFVLLFSLATRLIKYLYAKRNRLLRNHRNNIHFGIDNIARVLLGLGFIITVFGLFGIDLKSLLTSLSIVAAAVAIISRDFINDFLVGLYFSFSRNFEINDYIKMGDHRGKTTEIDILKIRLLNDDDDLVIIPNSKIYNSEIINYTKRDIRRMSIDFQLDIKAVSDIESLEKDLITSIADFSEYIEPASYNLKIMEVKRITWTSNFNTLCDVLTEIYSGKFGKRRCGKC